MSISIEVRCDLTGLSKKHIGESEIAIVGNQVLHDINMLESELNTFIRKSCNSKNKLTSLYTIYMKNDKIILNRKTMSINNISARGCAQIIMNFSTIKEFKEFLLTSFSNKLLISNDFSEYTDQFIQKNEPIEINLKNNINLDIEDFNFTKIKFYKKNNLYFSQNMMSSEFLFFLLTNINLKEQSISIVSGLSDKDLNYFIKIFNLKNDFIEKEFSEIIKKELKKQPENNNISLDIELRTIEVLSNYLDSLNNRRHNIDDKIIKDIDMFTLKLIQNIKKKF